MSEKCGGENQERNDSEAKDGDEGSTFWTEGHEAGGQGRGDGGRRGGDISVR